MTLGFSVQSLLPDARGGGKLRMGLRPIPEEQWLQSDPDIATRKAAFAVAPVVTTSSINAIRKLRTSFLQLNAVAKLSFRLAAVNLLCGCVAFCLTKISSLTLFFGKQ